MAPEQSQAVRYVADGRLSRFTVRAFATGLLSMVGHNPQIAIRDFVAEGQCRDASLADASLNVRVDPTYLSVASDGSDRDRREMEREMKETVLEISRFPEITFQSTQIAPSQLGNGRFRVEVTGDLLLHGVTRRQEFSAMVTLNGDTLHAHGEFSLLQSEFDIKPVSVAGGMLKLKDELKFSFDLTARRQG